MVEEAKATDRNVVALTESLIMIGSEIQQVRKARQMTLKTLSEATGISISHLSAIERGAANPSLATVRRVADALD
ncbi:MAG: helix-turn-helix transcriptional regulator, partial [Gammaproteobacteria bacterium]|nr:helix-turn-helix transcriptional regulator [Gammaproteobacteria bacterium]